MGTQLNMGSRPKENGSSQGSPYQAGKSKSKLLRDSLELIKVKGPDGKVKHSIKPVEEKFSFDKGFFVFIRAVQLLAQKNNGVVLVGLAGPSGSGKSKFSEKISDFIPDAAIISMDMYNDASRVIDQNFDDPRLTDYDLLMENLQDLRDGKPTKIPLYSFKESKRIGYREQAVPSSRIVIIEGIYALSQRISSLLDLRVSITGGVHFDLVKRVLRDISRSGQQPEEIIQQISDTVYPMYKAYIEPDLKTAHLRIYNTFNPFSGFMNATYILKSDKDVSKQQIKACLKADHICKKESEMFDIYLLPPESDPETCQSWLRMRNRDGRYDLRFEEWVLDDPFMISPRISFEVSAKILGGLMALGYQIGPILKRTSVSYSDDKLTIKIDEIEGMESKFVQVQGKERSLVHEAAKNLGFEGSYIPRSYIEQIQRNKLLDSFQRVPDDLRAQFDIDSDIPDDSPLGKSPLAFSPLFERKTGFHVNERPTLASSAPASASKLHRTHSNGSLVNGLISQQLRGIPESNGSKTPSRAPSQPASDCLTSNSGHSSDDCGSTIRESGNGLFPLNSSEARNVPASDKKKRLSSGNSVKRLERMVLSLSEQLENISRRPEQIASQIDFHLQALTAQQQALNRQVHELPKAVEALQKQMDEQSGPSKPINKEDQTSKYLNYFLKGSGVALYVCIGAFWVSYKLRHQKSS